MFQFFCKRQGVIFIKSIGVRGAHLLFSEQEEIELKGRYSEEEIEILFFDKASIQLLLLLLLR